MTQASVTDSAFNGGPFRPRLTRHPVPRILALARKTGWSSLTVNLVAKGWRPAADTRRPAPVPRVRIWRRRAGGTVMIAASYGLPVALSQLPQLEWHWFGSVWFVYGEPLSLLPGVVLVALVAPLVSYRRRDALTMFFPLRGIRVAWIIGTRLGQLPHRDWPARANQVLVQGRQAARIAAVVNSYRRWRQRRTGRATPTDGTVLTPPSPPAAAPLLRTDGTGSSGFTSA
jgi:hypothetical protein